ncbi:MAG TPA: Hsp70 family protein [Saprospiraceae bacterium]
MSQTINFGIDLGTTNSAIAICENGEVSVFKNPRTLKQTLPSVVAFKGDRIIVGEKASELLQKESGDVFGGFKRRMGSMDRFSVAAVNRETSPIELSSLILKELKTFVLSHPPLDAVVITIPAAFDTNQSNATKEAGYAAGFTEVVLLQEPIAASLAYANRQKSDMQEGKWVVFDFGGGTFDVALTGIDDDEMKILDHEGDNFLGGKDIDRAIVEQYLIPELEKRGSFTSLMHKMRNTDGIYHRLYHKLIYLAEEAKIMVSSASETEIEFETVDEAGKALDIVLPFSRQQLDAIAMPFVQRALSLVDTLFRRNEITASDVKCILLVGGTTYLPCIRTALSSAFDVEINSSIDPTTAVVVGAAYFAGQRVKMNSRSTQTAPPSSGRKGLKIQMAYERLVKSDDTALMIKTDGIPVAPHSLRVTRQDGGFDSGMISLQSTHILQLPLLPNVYNDFEVKVYDAAGNTVHTDHAGITHGKFGIHGQPLPHPIGIEVDDKEDDGTYLDILFRKNTILPVRRTITKKVGETLTRHSTKHIAINVYEGDIDSIPQANKRIGTIEIHGKDLERDLVKGSDIELTIEISESRDVKVGAYLVLTDQHFEDTFSPSEIAFNPSLILETTKYYLNNLEKRRLICERTGNYEEAAHILRLIDDIQELEQKVHILDVMDGTDEKYQLEIQTRELGKRIHAIFNSSYLTRIIEEYMQEKRYCQILATQSSQSDIEIRKFEEIIAGERALLQEGDINRIRIKIGQLEAMVRRLHQPRTYTMEDLRYMLSGLRDKSFQDKSKAEKLFEQGQHAIEQNDMHHLANALQQLIQQYEKETTGAQYFTNRKTGLE